ncbi:hypothetical protein [Actinokineospora xionganensis]|uniref:Excreted virulence factor EspC (Type VII ESX diderm) n=1 Tax=Actinokineospora xionganensis TaxID=2684470 RepID=A0ABR7L0V5_9PSEU|nr:hypothetical protein [Actinokineospora xionganensis]MBC6446315.1 hypothetical protein [Actinokineospora xionganensis]
MARDEVLDMDHDGVAAVAADMNSLALALAEVQKYASGDGLKAEHFGGTPDGARAFTSFDAAVKALATSVGKAQKFCADASSLLTSSSKATKETDIDNTWNLNKAGGK